MGMQAHIKIRTVLGFVAGITPLRTRIPTASGSAGVHTKARIRILMAHGFAAVRTQEHTRILMAPGSAAAHMRVRTRIQMGRGSSEEPIPPHIRILTAPGFAPSEGQTVQLCADARSRGAAAVRAELACALRSFQYEDGLVELIAPFIEAM